MNKYVILFVSYITFIALNIDSHPIKYSLDYKQAAKNRIIVNDINQAYYSSSNFCSCNYIKKTNYSKPFLRNSTYYDNKDNNLKNNVLKIKYSRSNLT
jgi:hypothetical protein